MRAELASAIALAFIFSSAVRAQDVIGPEKKNTVAEILNVKGWNCERVVSVVPMTSDHFGKRFTVNCLIDGGARGKTAVLYEVAETIKGQILIKPFSLR